MRPGLHHLAAEDDLAPALHGSEEVGVQRVEPAVRRGVAARRADREGEPDAAEDHRPEPVGRLSDPRVAAPLVLEQIEELVDRGLLLLGPIRHVSARGTPARASR